MPTNTSADAVARGIESAASTIHEKADDMPGGPKVASAAHTAAEAMETAADYFREQDFRAMAGDVQRLLKKHPGATLLAATALGFVLARALSRD